MSSHSSNELTYEQRRPREITGYRARRELEIIWEDEHKSVHDWEYLRWQCPCAHCRGEGDVPGMLEGVTELTPEQTTLVGMEHIGHYAVALHWSDGHNTGLYTFEALRRLCRCPECQPIHRRAR